MRPRRVLKREHPHIAGTRTVNYLEAMSGREIPQLRAMVPPPSKCRAPRSPSDRPLERAVLAQCLKALRSDPRLAVVWRCSSGVFQEGDRYIRVGSRGMPDILGMLVSGRLFACEVKRPGAIATAQQQSVLANIRANGGIAGIATSAAEALALLA